MLRGWKAGLQQVCALICITYIYIHDRLGHQDPESSAGGHACWEGSLTLTPHQSQLWTHDSSQNLSWLLLLGQPSGGKWQSRSRAGEARGPHPRRQRGPQAGTRLLPSAQASAPPWGPAGDEVTPVVSRGAPRSTGAPPLSHLDLSHTRPGTG